MAVLEAEPVNVCDHFMQKGFLLVKPKYTEENVKMLDQEREETLGHLEIISINQEIFALEILL